MATKKTKYSDYIPVGLVSLLLLVLIGYPVARDKWFPSPPTHTVEWKEKVVEKEKIVEKEVAPTVSINSLHITVDEVIDGRTLKGTIELPLDVRLVNQTIRCVGYDTYDLTELKGLDAKNELAMLVEGADVFGMTGELSRDSEGNVLLTVYVRKNDAVVSVVDRLTEKMMIKPQETE